MEPETTVEVPDAFQGVYKNHFAMFIKNTVSMLFSLGLMVLIFASSYREGGYEMVSTWLMPIVLLFVLLTFIQLRIWLKTTFTFGPTEVTVVKDTVFKTVKNIQYSKLASINVRRSVIDIICGTTTLLFNVNSSVNSQVAEATLILKTAEADRLREEISKLIFQKEMEVVEDEKQETLVNISNVDVILHGFLGQPTVTSIVGIGSLLYSAIAMMFDTSGIITALIVFAFSTVVPWIRTILRYYNYRIYRVGDTITVESGLITTFRSSFQIKKVNSVRIREPLLARLIHKSVLEAEVVGLADTQGMPLLCPLKGKRTVQALAEQLVPEFIFTSSNHTQPRQSLVPTISYKVILAAILATIGAVIYLSVASTEDIGSFNIYQKVLLYGAVGIIGVAGPIVSVMHGVLAQGNREFEMGEDTFMLITGAYDRQADYIRYDKVQMCTVSSGPIQRMFKVGNCTVNMMASRGATKLTSGIFLKDELEEIGKEVMARIKDGRYDYRKYQ